MCAYVCRSHIFVACSVTVPHGMSRAFADLADAHIAHDTLALDSVSAGGVFVASLAQ